MGHFIAFIFFAALAHHSLASRCMGCPEEKDIKDPSVEYSLRKTLTGLATFPRGTDNEQTSLIKVTKLTTQIVAGVKNIYEFEARGVKSGKEYVCNLAIVLRPWSTPQETVLDYTCKPLANRNKRSLIPGGEFNVNLKDNEDIPRMKKLISDELNKEPKSDYSLEVVKVLRATQQVVSGLLTKLTVEVAATGNQNEGHKLCQVEVWEKSWLQMTKITKLDCQEAPKVCAGCVFEADSNDEKTVQVLERTLFNLNRAQTEKVWTLNRINKVRQQVVAGLRYIIEFEANDEQKLAHSCNTEILLQPWISKEPSVSIFKCTPLSH